MGCLLLSDTCSPQIFECSGLVRSQNDDVFAFSLDKEHVTLFGVYFLIRTLIEAPQVIHFGNLLIVSLKDDKLKVMNTCLMTSIASQWIETHFFGRFFFLLATNVFKNLTNTPEDIILRLFISSEINP